MKNIKLCPKCNTNEILRIPGWTGSYGTGNNIPVTWIKQIKVTRYVCEKCGYTEEWIDNPEDIKALIKKYK